MTRKGPSLVPSLILALSGGVIGVYGLIGAMGTWNRPDLDPPVGKMVLIFAGAAVFSVGAMMLLVVVVRPWFEKRDVDRIVDEIADELPDRRPRP